ncbi:hypothetical protein TNCV_4038131 [Trichonephila clavipes]|nr:hypothetical protein TNCV_4038131 [Trichonephila clavipes]
MGCCHNGIVVSDADCFAIGLGSNPGEDRDVCKCIVPSRQGGTLNSRRAASPLVRPRLHGRKMPGRIRFVPVYTATRQNPGSKCRSIFCSLFRLGTLGVKRRVFSTASANQIVGKWSCCFSGRQTNSVAVPAVLICPSN